MKKHVGFLSICAINVAVWLFSCAFPDIIDHLALDSAHVFSFTWITSLFTHAGFYHFFGNTMFVLPWAWILEPKIGKRAFIAVWLIAGVGGGLAWLLTPHFIFGGGSAIGASGACMGIMACSIMMLEEHWVIKGSALAIMAVLALQEYQLTVVTAFIPDGVAHSAHVGGFVFGILCAHFLKASVAPVVLLHKAKR